MRLNQHEENDKKKKGIALKASSSSIHEENDKEDSNEKNLEEDDDFSLFVKRFNKFLRNKGNQRRSNFNPKKKGEDSSLVPKCYECDQPGYLRFDCPVFKRRMKNPTRKIQR